MAVCLLIIIEPLQTMGTTWNYRKISIPSYYSFVYEIKGILNSYYMPGPVGGARDRLGEKKENQLSRYTHGAYTRVGVGVRGQTKKVRRKVK